MLNPFEIQRQMFTEFEKSFGDYFQKMMREPAFMQLVAQNMNGAMDLRALTKAQVESTLEMLQLPSSETIEKLYETIHQLESKVLDLEEQVEDVSAELRSMRAKTPTRMSASGEETR